MAILDSRWIDPRCLLLLAVTLCAGGAALSVAVLKGVELAGLTGAYTAGALLGASDGILNTIAITQLGYLSEDRSMLSRRTAFSLYQSGNVLFRCLGYALQSALPVTRSYTILWCLGLAGLLTVATLPLAPRITFVRDHVRI